MAATKTGNANPTFPLATGLFCSRIVVQSNKSMSGFNAISGDSIKNIKTLKDLFGKFVLGVYKSNIDVNSGGAYATGTVTLSSFAAADTVTINGVLLTGSATPSGIAQFLIGASDTATAVNLAACINANTGLFGTVYATSATTIVTLTCRVPGLIGNLCTTAISAHGSVSGGGKLASGADGNESVVAHGL